MTSSLDESLSKLNINAVDDHKIRLKYIKNQFQQGKSVFKGYQTFCKKFGDEEMKYKDFDFWYYRFKNGLNDLDYDRSKDPKTREFSDFPVEIVKKMVGKLRRREKMVLRNVSKGLREVVDNSEQYFGTILFQVNPNFVQLNFGDTDDDFNLLDGWFLDDKISWRQALIYLKMILKWPKLKVGTLHIEFRDDLGRRVLQEMAEATEKVFNSLNYQISVKRAMFTETTENVAMAVLPYLKPRFLESIHIIQHENYMILSEMLHLDQWRQAKNATLKKVVCPMERLSHFKKFTLQVQRMSKREFIQLKHACMFSSNFEECSVLIDDEISQEDILFEFDQEVFPIPYTDQLFVTMMIGGDGRTFIFEKSPPEDEEEDEEEEEF